MIDKFELHSTHPLPFSDELDLTEKGFNEQFMDAMDTKRPTSNKQKSTIAGRSFYKKDKLRIELPNSLEPSSKTDES